VESEDELRKRSVTFLKQASDLQRELENDQVAFDDESPDDPEEVERELAALVERADELAAEFKECFEGATEAWNCDDRALAKVLSTEGREKQGECEECNAEANSLRATLQAHRDGLRRLEKKGLEIARLKKEAARLAEAADRMSRAVKRDSIPRPSTAAKTDTLSSEVLDTFLNRLPEKHRLLVKEVTFDSFADHLSDDRVRFGRTDAKGRIQVKLPRGGPALNKQFISRIICHEVGHNVYRNLSPYDHQRWSSVLDSHISRLMPSLSVRYPNKTLIQLRAEAFADQYADYVVCPSVQLLTYSNMYYFMHDTIFNRIEYNINEWDEK
jgi:hypothetical protein